MTTTPENPPLFERRGRAHGQGAASDKPPCALVFGAPEVCALFRVSCGGALATFHHHPPRHPCQHAQRFVLFRWANGGARRTPLADRQGRQAPVRPTGKNNIGRDHLKGTATPSSARRNQGKGTTRENRGKPQQARAHPANRVTTPTRNHTRKPRPPPTQHHRLLCGALRRVERLAPRRRPPFGRPADNHSPTTRPRPPLSGRAQERGKRGRRARPPRPPLGRVSIPSKRVKDKTDKDDQRTRRAVSPSLSARRAKARITASSLSRFVPLCRMYRGRDLNKTISRAGTTMGL